MVRIIRVVGAFLLALLPIVVSGAPVRAYTGTVPQPATLNVAGVWAYQSILVPSDQLYVIDYTITYSSPTGTVMNSTYGAASQFFIIQLLNSSTMASIMDVPAWSVWGGGYSRNIALLYIASPTVTWGGSTPVGARIQGNPLVTGGWAGGTTPNSTVHNVDRWSSFTDVATTRRELTTNLRNLMLGLSADLQAQGVILSDTQLVTQSEAGSIVLSSAGQSYLSQLYYVSLPGSGVNQAIGVLKTIAPDLFDVNTRPEVDPRGYGGNYAGSLVTDLAGTPLDLSPVSAKIGISSGWIGAGLFVIAFLVLAWFLTRRGLSPRLIIVLGAFGIVFGSFFLLPMAWAIGMAVFAVFFIGFILFYRGSST